MANVSSLTTTPLEVLLCLQELLEDEPRLDPAPRRGIVLQEEERMLPVEEVTVDALVDLLVMRALSRVKVIVAAELVVV